MNKLETARKIETARMAEYPDIAENVGTDLGLAALTVQEMKMLKRSVNFRLNELYAVWTGARGNWKSQVGSAIHSRTIELLTIEGFLNDAS